MTLHPIVPPRYITPLPDDVAGLVGWLNDAAATNWAGQSPARYTQAANMLESQAARIAAIEAQVAAADRLAEAIAPVADLVAGSGIDFQRKYPALNAELDKSRQDEWHDIIGWIVADALTAYIATKEASK